MCCLPRANPFPQLGIKPSLIASGVFCIEYGTINYNETNGSLFQGFQVGIGSTITLEPTGGYTIRHRILAEILKKMARLGDFAIESVHIHPAPLPGRSPLQEVTKRRGYAHHNNEFGPTATSRRWDCCHPQSNQ